MQTSDQKVFRLHPLLLLIYCHEISPHSSECNNRSNTQRNVLTTVQCKLQIKRFSDYILTFMKISPHSSENATQHNLLTIQASDQKTYITRTSGLIAPINNGFDISYNGPVEHNLPVLLCAYPIHSFIIQWQRRFIRHTLATPHLHCKYIATRSIHGGAFFLRRLLIGQFEGSTMDSPMESF